MGFSFLLDSTENKHIVAQEVANIEGEGVKGCVWER
jgi:hypothetical protein